MLVSLEKILNRFCKSLSISSSAFTLAEVLITLGIIGIVAAMTIPTLIEKSRKQETSVELKKFYSMMNQVIRLSEIDNGPSTQWTITDAITFFNTYIKPYIKYSKVDTSSSYPLVYLNDGSTFSVYKGECIDMVVDTNGDKKPNAGGIDKFDFLFCLPPSNSTYFLNNSNKTFGAYYEGETREQALDSCKNNSGTCSALLMLDNWEFKDDYPYKL